MIPQTAGTPRRVGYAQLGSHAGIGKAESGGLPRIPGELGIKRGHLFVFNKTKTNYWMA